MRSIILVASFIFASANAGGVGIAGGFFGVKPPIIFEDGNVGVNFAGYHAAAGLGGLLNGGAVGGLHAEAGTSTGQKAVAGLGGRTDTEGAIGGLYAGATAGGKVKAEAAIAGEATGGGAIGGSYAAAGEKVVTKTIQAPAPVIVEHEVREKPVIHRTYVERTVIPNYVEKKIQVPSYEEKIVRVPTYVEKTVRVPAPPTVIEKTVEVPPEKGPEIQTGVHVEGAVAGGGSETVQVEHHVETAGHARKGIFGGLFASGGFGGGYAGGAGGGGAIGGSGGGSYRVTKVANPGLINDIFNIPISTLKAVNQLVGGIVGGASGSIAVSKQYGTY